MNFEITLVIANHLCLIYPQKTKIFTKKWSGLYYNEKRLNSSTIAERILMSQLIKLPEKHAELWQIEVLVNDKAKPAVFQKPDYSTVVIGDGAYSVSIMSHHVSVGERMPNKIDYMHIDGCCSTYWRGTDGGTRLRAEESHVIRHKGRNLLRITRKKD